MNAAILKIFIFFQAEGVVHLRPLSQQKMQNKISID